MFDNFRKARCIRVYANRFWKVSLFSVTCDNERTESCDCLFTTPSFDEGIFCTWCILYFSVCKSLEKELLLQ